MQKKVKKIYKVLIVTFIIFIGVIYFQFRSNFFETSKEEAIVLGEESINGELKNYASEDYKTGKIILNGDIDPDFNYEDANTSLDLADLKSEVYVPKDKDETRMLLSWKTNKSATAEITFSKKGEKAKKIVQEEKFGLNHAVVFLNLDADSIYAYKIRSRDRWGRENLTDEYVFYSGAPNVSFIDVLENAAQKLFGWAIKK